MNIQLIENCFKETQDHIHQVQTIMELMINGLAERARVHDRSKLEPPELEVFAEYTPKLKSSTYGSDEYKTFLKEMKVALDHHYANNSHHPEHFKKYVCNGCFKEFKTLPNHCDVCMYSQFQEESDYTQMNLLDLIEMFCDWKAATMRHDDGDIYKSIEINKKRFKMSDDLVEIFKNTARMIE